MVFDAIFMICALAAGFAGLIVSNFHLFRVSFVFSFIKIYVQICITSLLRKYYEYPKAKSVAPSVKSPSAASLAPQAEIV